MKKLYEFYKKVTQSESVRIGIYVLIGSTLIVMLLSFFCGDYSNVSEPVFWEGLRVEAHGMLFDILVIGVIVLILNKLTEKGIDNRRYLEEIDDFRGWESEEAAYRNAGNLNRLKRNRYRGKLNLKQCYLGCVNLQRDGDQDILGYIKPYLNSTNLSGVAIVFADLQNADLRNANLQKAKLFEIDLRDANLFWAKLQMADLQEVNLQGANLQNAYRQDAILLNVHLRNAKNLTLDQLSKAKSLYGAELDPELRKQVEAKYSHLLEEPVE